MLDLQQRFQSWDKDVTILGIPTPTKDELKSHAQQKIFRKERKESPPGGSQVVITDLHFYAASHPFKFTIFLLSPEIGGQLKKSPYMQHLIFLFQQQNFLTSLMDEH